MQFSALSAPALLSVLFLATQSVSVLALPTAQDGSTGLVHAREKLRSGKCTDAGGQCAVRTKGVLRHFDCERGTKCSSNGASCYFEGHTLSTHSVVNCT